MVFTTHAFLLLLFFFLNLSYYIILLSKYRKHTTDGATPILLLRIILNILLLQQNLLRQTILFTYSIFEFADIHFFSYIHYPPTGVIFSDDVIMLLCITTVL